MRDALSLLDQCIAFYLGQTLTYDKVLDVLGAVDTEVFSKLLRKVLAGDVTSAIRILEDLIVGGRELSQFVGDFTWYMRNLLLVKTSDNPEEAIDFSSENLKLLKEESEMTDSDTLMRYIRIFSDLSNQIRFATQKRVLVEIALIKLCLLPHLNSARSPAAPGARQSSVRVHGYGPAQNPDSSPLPGGTV